MLTKQYLYQVRNLDRAVNRKLEEIFKLKTMATNITVTYDSERVQTSPSDKLSSTVAKIVDYENEVDALVDKYIATRKRIIEQIESLPNEDYRDVLTERYINGLTFDAMTTKLHMSRNKIIQHVHPKALADFETRFGYLYK